MARCKLRYEEMAEKSIWWWLWNVRAVTFRDFDEAIGDIVDGCIWAFDGLKDVGRGLWGLAGFILNIITWPVTKPILCAVARHRMRIGLARRRAKVPPGENRLGSGEGYV